LAIAASRPQAQQARPRLDHRRAARAPGAGVTRYNSAASPVDRRAGRRMESSGISAVGKQAERCATNPARQMLDDSSPTAMKPTKVTLVSCDLSAPDLACRDTRRSAAFVAAGVAVGVRAGAGEVAVVPPAGPLGFRPMSHSFFTEVIICLVPIPTPARPGQTIS